MYFLGLGMSDLQSLAENWMEWVKTDTQTRTHIHGQSGILSLMTVRRTSARQVVLSIRALTVMFTGSRQLQKGNGQSKPGCLATFSGEFVGRIDLLF